MSKNGDSHSKSTEALYTLSVASKLSDTPTHSIRQYIDKGLLLPFKTKTNRHLFSEVDILRLRCIRKHLDIQGLNIAGINALFALVPCWVIKPCTENDRLNCDAYNSDTVPCWMASEKGPKCKNNDCRVCEVYRLPEQCTNLKDFIKQLTNT
jgi:MerR family transcriptional regulator/heat shock protein HspR